MNFRIFLICNCYGTAFQNGKQIRNLQNHGHILYKSESALIAPAILKILTCSERCVVLLAPRITRWKLYGLSTYDHNMHKTKNPEIVMPKKYEKKHAIKISCRWIYFNLPLSYNHMHENHYNVLTLRWTGPSPRHTGKTNKYHRHCNSLTLHISIALWLYSILGSNKASNICHHGVSGRIKVLHPVKGLSRRKLTVIIRGLAEAQHISPIVVVATSNILYRLDLKITAAVEYFTNLAATGLTISLVCDNGIRSVVHKKRRIVQKSIYQDRM